MKKSMIQRLGCLVASISFAFVGATAFADAWFTAKEAGGDLLTTGGTWTKDDASWDASTQTYNNFNTPLKFEATESKSNIASITTTVKFTAKDELTEEEIDGAKGGLAVLEEEDGSGTNYYGVVSGAWVKLAGAEPDLTQAVTASISLFTVGKDANKKTYINYTIGSTPLTVGGNADILTDVADASIKSVEYLGKCELASLSGATAAPYVAQGADKKFYASISAAGNQAVTIVNATSYTPTATTIGSCNISDPDGFLTLNQGSLANVGLKVATVNGQVAIRPNFTSNDGDGSAADKAFKIGSAADLEAFRKGVLNQKFGVTATPTLKYFKQTADIDLGSVAWAGVGTFSKTMDAKAFCGYYDGGNKTIKNLYLALNATPKATYAGLFGQINGSTVGAGVKNLTIEWAGWKKQDGSVLVPTQAANNGNIGGAALVGLTEGNVDIENVTAKMADGVTSISGTHSIAGLGVKIGNGAVIKNCTNEVNIIGMEANVGGLLNLLQGAKKDRDGIVIEGCVNKGTVTAKGTYEDDGTKQAADNGAGGLAAYTATEIKLTVKNCESLGSITPEGSNGAKIGSIIGYLYGGTLTGEGANKAAASIAAIGSFHTGVETGFDFATVSSDVATFVASPAAGGSYKVMSEKATLSADISLAKDQTIAFDNALYPTFDATAKIVAAVPASTKITSATSGTVTTFTCAEKAKATVSITMTGATATVSVADGASVYEGTTITVTGEAATTGYEAPITVKINDVERKSYTTTASDTSIAIVIAATSKIVPIKPDPEEPTVPEITVNKDDFPGMNIDEIKAYLKGVQSNKQPGWVNYALGIDDNVTPQIGVDPKDEATEVINILGNFNIKEGTGVEVKCTINNVEGDAIPVSGLDGTAQTFEVVVTVGEKMVVSKTIGANKVTTKANGERTLVSVPWSNGEQPLTMDKLFKTSHLEEGDVVEAYDTVNDTYYKWAWTGSAWQKPEAPKKFLLGGSEIVQPPAEEYTVAPGQALWLTTTEAANVIQLGEAPKEFEGTTVAAAQWGLVANPLSGETKSLSAIVGEVTDGVTVQMEDSEGATHLYTYEGGEWGYNGYTTVEKTVRGKKTNVAVPAHIAEDPEIAPGKGFWFLNEGNSAATLDWNPESTAN